MAYTTPGQTRARIYRFVREQLLAGTPPTVREVQTHFGFRAVESARTHLEALVREGRLTKHTGEARGYRLPGYAGGPFTLAPLIGRVQAGALTEAIEDPEGFVAVEERGAELFALRVRGDSMVGAGILEGDIVVVRRQPTAEPGDVVVALVGEEATVKRLRHRGRRVVLEAANPAYPPIELMPSELELLGKVVEVRRSLEP